MSTRSRRRAQRMVARAAARRRRRRARRRRCGRRRSASISACLVDDRPARGVDQERRGLHPRQVARRRRARGCARDSTQVDGDDVGRGEQLVALDPPDARPPRRRSVGQVLAPGDDVHAERLRRRARPGCRAGRARRRRACAPCEVGADGVLPAARADGAVLARRRAARAARISAQVSSAVAAAPSAGAADRDAELGGGGDVDRARCACRW